MRLQLEFGYEGVSEQAREPITTTRMIMAAMGLVMNLTMSLTTRAVKITTIILMDLTRRPPCKSLSPVTVIICEGHYHFCSCFYCSCRQAHY